MSRVGFAAVLLLLGGCFGDHSVEDYCAAFPERCDPHIVAIEPAVGPRGGGIEVDVTVSVLEGEAHEFEILFRETRARVLGSPAPNVIRVELPKGPPMPDAVDVTVRKKGRGHTLSKAFRYEGHAVTWASPRVLSSIRPNVVTIEGRHLSSVTEVRVGNHQAEIDWSTSTDTTMIVRAPPVEPGPVPVVVREPAFESVAGEFICYRPWTDITPRGWSGPVLGLSTISELFAVTPTGVWVHNRYRWSMHEFTEGGRIQAAAFEDARLYLLSTEGVLFSWLKGKIEARIDGPTDLPALPEAVVYADGALAVRSGGVVRISRDLGATWQPIPEIADGAVTDIAGSVGALIVAETERVWRISRTEPPENFPLPLVSRLFSGNGALFALRTDGIWRSVDYGRTFDQIWSGLANAVGAESVESAAVVIHPGGISKQSESGWIPADLGLGAGPFDLLEVDWGLDSERRFVPVIYAAGAVGVWRSNPEGS